MKAHGLLRNQARPDRRAASLCRFVPSRWPPAAQLKVAGRAGLTTLLACWLTLALFLVPYWAARTNFPGHQHAAGTPPHLHSVQAVVGYALVVAVVTVLLTLRPTWPLTSEPVSWLERPTLRGAHRSRAPPAF